jgi:hypothetical protein
LTGFFPASTAGIAETLKRGRQFIFTV